MIDSIYTIQFSMLHGGISCETENVKSEVGIQPKFTFHLVEYYPLSLLPHWGGRVTM